MKSVLMTTIASGAVAAAVAGCCSSPCCGPQEDLDDETGFVSIFNGTDLSGWEGDTATYFAADGLLQCRQSGKFGGGNLRTVKSYENFVLRFEFKLPPEANNGVAIRCAPNARASQEGMEIQLLDDTAPYYWEKLKLKPYQYTGSIYGVVPAARKPGFEGLDAPAKSTYLNPVGTWNEMQVRADGTHITVHLNRVRIVDVDVAHWKGDGDTADHRPHPGLHNLCGRIGWCGHGYNVQWRNIRVKELPPSPLRIDGRWAFDDIGGKGAWLGLDDFEETGVASLLVLGGSPSPEKPVRNADGSYTISKQWIYEGHDDWNVFRQLTFWPTNGEYMNCTFAQSRGGLKPDFKPQKYVARRIPVVGRPPDLKYIDYENPIDLLKDGLAGWEPKEKDKPNCWVFKDGVLENTGSGANLLTKRRDFKDFKIAYDVRVDDVKGCNSGVFLRGIYELQVIDSFGKPVDSHNMAALYGRITPSVAAEKPTGRWQHVEAILCDRHLTVTLNDVRIIDNQPVLGMTGSALTGNEFVPGPIYLQGDHKGGAYRNMYL